MTKHTLQKNLQTLGFSKNVAKVYITLVELGETKAGAIVKKTGLHRHLVYTALDELEEKKLVSRIQKGGVARFVPLSPDALLTSVLQTKDLVNSIISEIHSLQSDTSTQKVIIYESLEDMAAAEIKLYDLMQPGETQYILGLSSKWYELLGESKVRKLADIQKEKNFSIKGIGSFITENERQYIEETNGLTNFKLIPGVGSHETEMNILQDRILIKVFVEPYTCVEIINHKLARDYRRYFETLWNQEVITYRGWDQIRHLMFERILPAFAGNTEYAQGAGYDIADDTGAFEAFWLEYNSRRIELGINRHVLMYEQYREQFEQEITDAGDPEHRLTHMRFLPKEFNSPMEIHIYGDTVVLIAWQGIPTATVYSRSEMAKGFKNQFDMLWNIASE